MKASPRFYYISDLNGQEVIGESLVIYSPCLGNDTHCICSHHSPSLSFQFNNQSSFLNENLIKVAD